MRIAEMKRQKSDKKETVKGIVIAVIILLVSLFTEFTDSAGIIAAAFAVVILFAGIFLVLKVVHKKKAGSKDAIKAAKAKKLADLSGDWNMQYDNEKAIGCTCLHGKDKYIHQAEEFYRNGLIDREELRVLKERYSNLELPDGIVD